MKKGIVVFFATLAVAVAHAVQLQWTLPNAEWTTSVTSGSLIYTESGLVTDTNLADVINVANGTGTLDGFASVVNGEGRSKWTLQDDNGGDNTNDILYAAINGDPATIGSYILVLFDAQGKYAYAVLDATSSDVRSAFNNDVGGDTSVNRGTPIAPTFSGTLVSDVPEPTVLALLALGVAGLALRRKA